MVWSEELAGRAVNRFSPVHTAACQLMLSGPIMGQLANKLVANERSLFLKLSRPLSSQR